MNKLKIGGVLLFAIIPSPTGQFANLGNLDINNMIGIIISATLVLSIIIFFFYLLTGGLRYIVSGGKKENVDAAKSHIVNAFIGLAIVFSTWAIVSFVGGVFGVNLLSFPIG